MTTYRPSVDIPLRAPFLKEFILFDLHVLLSSILQSPSRPNLRIPLLVPFTRDRSIQKSQPSRKRCFASSTTLRSFLRLLRNRPQSALAAGAALVMPVAASSCRMVGIGDD
jgi:hypothetical protein